MSGKILKGPEIQPGPEEKYFLGELIFTTSAVCGNQLCQIDADSGRSESYFSMNKRSVRLALSLQKNGITSDDIVMVCSFNTMDNTIPLVAASYLGAKTCNLDPTLSVGNTKHLILSVTPKIIFVEESALPLIEEALTSSTLEIKLVVMGMTSKYAKFTDWVCPHDSESTFKPVKEERNDVGALFFSSGTTGLPKTISQSHKSLLASTKKIMIESKVMLHCTTFFWATAHFVFVLMIMNKGTRVFSRNMAVDGETWLRIIEKFKVTATTFAFPYSYELTNVQHPENYNTSSLCKILLGGTPVDSKQLKRLQQLFKNAEIFIAYGSTDVGAVSLYTFDASNYSETLGATGKIMAGIEVKIVDPDTKQILPAYKKGEILVKTANPMKGYFKDDTESCIDKYGFFKTGDLGYYDKDEHLFVVGRSNGMFRYLTWHIVPEYIESVLVEHPDINDAVVFGVPHDRVGRLATACVVLKKGSSVTKEEIQDFLAHKVCDEERLRGGLYFVESLPKTPSGKIARKEVINLFGKLNPDNALI